MLVQPILSLFTRMIPEAFLVIFAIYRLTNQKFDMKKIILSSIIGGFGVFITRLLPVHFGVHTILAIMLYILLAVKLNKIEIYKAIATGLILQIILFISDFILVFIYTKILFLPTEKLFGQSFISALVAIPPLFVFYLIIYIIAWIKDKRHE
jgi:hypothetical protein